MIGIMIWIIAKNNQLFLDTYPNPPKISSKLVGNFLNYPTTTDRQTDRQTHRVKNITSLAAVINRHRNSAAPTDALTEFVFDSADHFHEHDRIRSEIAEEAEVLFHLQ